MRLRLQTDGAAIVRGFLSDLNDNDDKALLATANSALGKVS